MEFRRIAADNQRIVDAGRYRTERGEEIDIASPLAAAIKGTRQYGPARSEITSELTGPPTSTPKYVATSHNAPGHDASDHAAPETDDPVERSTTSAAMTGTRIHARLDTRIEVTGEDTVSAARRLAGLPDGGRVAVLNFASARHPGGGYLTGAKAQEEDLCRKTLLHPCLLAAPEYYAAHERARDPFYSDRLIYSPDVPVIRDHQNRLTGTVFAIDVITCAAPNAGVIQRYRPDSVGRIPQQLTQRAAAVLAAAARHGAQRLVLGAWGCGVFRNDPRQVAAAFRTHLTGEGGYRDAFAQITFAVLDRAQPQHNLGAFREMFEG